MGNDREMRAGFQAKIPTQPVKVRVYTPEFLVEGHVHVKSGGYKGRVSDTLNHADPFLVLTDARMWARQGMNTEGPATECAVVMISIGDIQILIPESGGG